MADIMDEAITQFAEYFARNYPGPDTVIHDPNWHAPRLFRAVLRAMRDEAIKADPVDILYTNWRGETALRKITPLSVWFGSTRWHPECGWLVSALDHEKDTVRDFALKDFGPHSSSNDQRAFQARVRPWIETCFGAEVAADKLERCDRLMEEVFELLQACDYPRDRIRSLEAYVYGRPKGDIAQEVGGVMMTLAAHCLAHDVDMHRSAETELARVWTKVDAIRAKQAAKPTGSALPIATAPADADISPYVENSRLRGALEHCQKVLASLVTPDAITGTTVVNAYANVIAAERLARAALEGEKA